MYKIASINDEYIVFKSENKVYKKYIYEIIPVTLLDFSEEVQNGIYMIYNEFLREINLDLQIYISNRKMNVENYIEEIKSGIINQKEMSFKAFLNNYLNDIKNKINSERIYITRYYIALSLETKGESNIEEIDSDIYKLNRLGCVVNRVKGKQNIENILYESINKESVI